MANENPTRRLDPTQPMPPEAAEFTRAVGSMLNGQPKDDATVSKALEGLEGMFDVIAAGLYTLASMLVGEGEDSIRLVESAVTNADVSACTDPEQARRSSRRALVESALDLIASRSPQALAAPATVEHVSTCIEDDDLDAAGMSRDELDRMLAGPDRVRVRAWLESLPTATRVVFVLRAVAVFSAADSAALLSTHGGPIAAGWTPEAVRELFRQALCSLASQVIHAGVTNRS